MDIGRRLQRQYSVNMGRKKHTMKAKMFGSILVVGGFLIILLDYYLETKFYLGFGSAFVIAGMVVWTLMKGQKVSFPRFTPKSKGNG